MAHKTYYNDKLYGKFLGTPEQAAIKTLAHLNQKVKLQFGQKVVISCVSVDTNETRHYNCWFDKIDDIDFPHLTRKPMIEEYRA